MTDYLELLLNAQVQEEPEEEMPDLGPRFFSAVPSGAWAEKKAVSPKPAKTKMETAEPVPQDDLPTADTRFDAAPTAESRMRETMRIHARILKDETAGMDMAEAAETGERKVIRAEATEIRTSGRETDEAESGVTRDPGAWAAGVGGTSPTRTDRAEIDVATAAEAGIVGLQTAGSQTAKAGIAGALAALRQQERTLSGGTFGSEEFGGSVGVEASARTFGTEGTSRTAGAKESGAPSLYRQMTQAEQAVSSLRHNAQILTVTESGSAAPGPGAAELDEIFSRDARRYDGGFSLF